MKKRVFSLFLTVTLFLGILPLSSRAEVAVNRYDGKDRFETAIRVANVVKRELGVSKFGSIILASGSTFADALSGSYLATVKQAPILLTYKDKQNQLAVEYIKNNLQNGGTVYILGGGSAVPKSIDGMLSQYQVRRLDGSNRFDTNLKILREAGVPSGKDILVCTATNFADSLSASAAGCPILLVHNEKGKLTADQKSFLKSLGKVSFRIIGGENAVSQKLENELKNYGTVRRLAGSNRFETSVKVAETYFGTPTSAVLAYAANYPDGLCGGVLANILGAPLILTMNGKETDAKKYVDNKAVRYGVVLGTDTLISDTTVNRIFARTGQGGTAAKLGSAGKISGKTLLVSIYANDAGTRWDFNTKTDNDTVSTLYGNLDAGVRWLEEQCLSYGVTADFVFEWPDYPDLCYAYDFGAETIVRVDGGGYYTQKNYVDQYIPTEALKAKYGADNVIYVFYFNTDENNTINSWCLTDRSGCDTEIINIYARDDYSGGFYYQSASGFAHEILHCFGTPDLYYASEIIPQAYVDHCRKTGSRDIMYTISLGSEIKQEFTELDAYYVGLTFSCEEVERWGLGKSRHFN